MDLIEIVPRIFHKGKMYEMTTHPLTEMDKEAKLMVLRDHCFISYKQKELSKD